MSRIILSGIDKFYGTNHVLKNLDLVVEDGDFMTLLGPSGCGKTTTLRVIAGLERPQNGMVYMDDREIINAREQFFLEPSKRGLNLVFQSYALWPHMTVFDNVAFVLSVNHVSKADIKIRVADALRRMRIDELAERYPSELSGGQQQRVAIARAIVSEPSTLLLDEPLSNLDAKLRVDMRSELKRLHKELGTTVIYVTHDQVEALTMSTKIAIFFEGALEQVDTPMGVYQNPVSLRVADFIGNPRINFIPGKAQWSQGLLSVQSVLGVYQFDSDVVAEELPQEGLFDCIVGVRPEQVTLWRKEMSTAVPARVYSCMPAGSETLVQLQVEGENMLVKRIGLKEYHSDQPVWLGIDPESVNIFRKDNGRLIKRATAKESEE